MKICTSCKKKKTTTEFYRNPGTKDGLGSQCKACDREGKRVRRFDRKQKLIDHFGGECVKCGYDKCTDALEFHHKDGDKEFAISSAMYRDLKRLIKEASKCELVCANCHREIHKSNLPRYGGKRRTRE